MSALEERLLEEMQPPIEVTEDDERFVIDNDHAADWALRKIAQKQRQIEANRQLAEDEIARITAWLEEVTTPLAGQADHLEALLVEYHRKLLAEDDKRKTVKLPGGNLVARKRPDNVEITDEEAFIEWAEAERHNLLHIKTSPDRNAIKEAVLKDGEVIPHVTPVKGDIQYRIETNRKDQS